ncbi:MAG: hypothetical protein WD607_06280 [Candidatus Paceibacterota bacterium]
MEELDKTAMQELVLNNGSDSLQELFDWFIPIFGGQILHWMGGGIKTFFEVFFKIFAKIICFGARTF